MQSADSAEVRKGRPKGGGYIVRGDNPDDLLQMDRDYERRVKDGTPFLFQRADAHKVEAYWGRWSGDEFVVGARARIWALTLLLARHSCVARAPNLPSKLSGNIAHDLSDPIKDHVAAIARDINREGHKREPATIGKVREILQDLISPHTRDCSPPFESAGRFVDLVRDYVQLMLAPTLSGDEAADALASALAEPAATPSEIYQRLCEIAPPPVELPAGFQRTERDWIDRLAWIDPLIAQGLYTEHDKVRTWLAPSEPDHDAEVVAHANRFFNSGPKTRILVISGPALMGKKVKLRAILRDIAGPEKFLRLGTPERRRREQHDMPILVVAANSLDNRSLVQTVFEFFQRYDAAYRLQRAYGSKLADPPTAHEPLEAAALRPEEMLEHIYSDYKHLPALFVFTDVDDFQADSPRHVVRDIAINRLIAALLDTNSETRILITTSGGPDSPCIPPGRQTFDPLKIKSPRIQELSKFAPSEAFARIPEDFFPTLGPHGRRAGQKSEVRGDDMVGLAAIFGLAFAPAVDAPGLSDDELATINGFLEQLPKDRADVRIELYRILVRRIRGTGLLEQIALIAVSDDGVREGSFPKMLSTWRHSGRKVLRFDDDGQPSPEPDMLPLAGSDEIDGDYDDAREDHVSSLGLRRALAAFARSAGRTTLDGSDGVPDSSRFLRRVRISRYDPEEYSFAERHSAEDMRWEMDPGVSASLLRALREEDPQLFFEANRLIAKLARRRAQNKKVLMRVAVGSRAADDSSRDIQSYVNLLASIAPEVLAATTAAPRNIQNGNEGEAGKQPDIVDAVRVGALASTAPLRLSEGDIYSINPKRFNAGRALRFATYALLREDIDHDFRLTMVFDEDALRLNLYLLLFRDPGRFHLDPLLQLSLEQELPAHFTSGLFSPEEVLDLMESVALSAFHAQRFEIVEQIASMAWEFGTDRLDDMPSRMARIWCCQLDAAILLGHRNGRESHAETLAFVTEKLDTHFSFVNEAPEVVTATGRAKLKAEMRLLSRKAELLWLTQPDREKAVECYMLLREREALFATVHGQHDPAVLSGRVARRYIRFLLRDPVLRLESGQRRFILAQLRELLGVNMSRLRRFAGADRVGVLVDLARIMMIEGEHEAARRYADEAHRRAFSGNISHAGKLDALSVIAHVYLDAIRHSLALGTVAEPAVERHKWLGRATNAVFALTVIAERIGYKPVQGLGQALLARLHLADVGLREAGMPYERAVDRDTDPVGSAVIAADRAREIMEGIGDHSLDDDLDQLDELLEMRNRFI